MVIRPRLIGVWRRLSAQRLDELGQLLGGTCPALGLAGVLGGLLARLSVTPDKGLKGECGHIEGITDRARGAGGRPPAWRRPSVSIRSGC